MRTLATACDGIEECLNGEDETWICTNRERPIWIVLGCMALVLIVVVSLKYREMRRMKKNSSKVVRMSDSSKKFMKTLETANFKENHNDSEFWKKINVFILFNKWVLSERLRIQTSDKLYDLEVDHHGGNEVEAKICMKKNLHRSVYKVVIDDKFPGIIRKYFHKIEKLMDHLENHSIAWWVLSKIRQVFVFYFDIFKDFYIAIVIFFVAGAWVSLLILPTNLPFVVFYCFLTSILLPLMLSSHVLARDRIKLLGDSATRKKKIWIYCKTMTLSLLNPMLIIHEYESKKEKMKNTLKDSVNKEDGVDIDAVIKLLEEQDILKRQYVEFLKTDLGLETIYQTAGQSILLLLAAELEKQEESTATTGGLEKIFEKDLLTVSILLSLKTCVSLHFKSVRQGFIQ